MKSLHIISGSHITRGFFDTLSKSGIQSAVVAILPPGDSSWPDESRASIIRTSSRIDWILKLSRAAVYSDKIVIHGLSGGWVTWLLAFSPWLHSRMYWLIWGADLYQFLRARASFRDRIDELARRIVISRAGYLVTYLEGDVELARTWYKARGVWIDCLLYSGNTSSADVVTSGSSERVLVQVGNSADPSNGHLEVFEALSAIDADFDVYVPLAYGDSEYRRDVISAGTAIFGDRFRPELSLVSLDDYVSRLKAVDVAVFNHRRQQAMGNTIRLLSMGKRVYLHRDQTPSLLFDELGIEVFDVNGELDLSRLSPKIAGSNSALVREYFSLERLHFQWRTLLDAGED